MHAHLDKLLIDRLSDEVDCARNQEQQAYRTMRAMVPAIESGPLLVDTLTPTMLRAIAAHTSAHDHRRALEDERRSVTEVSLRVDD